MAVSLIERARAYEEAYNRHDLQAVMAMYTDDIRFEMIGDPPRLGKEEVRLVEEYCAAVNSMLSFKDLVETADGVSFRATERNDWSRLAGIGEIEYVSCHFTFRDGLLAAVRVEMAEPSTEASDRVWRSLMAWASKERGEALAQLMPAGEPVFEAETARGWLALLQEWRQSQRGTTV
jgi:hypothetical protein